MDKRPFIPLGAISLTDAIAGAEQALWLDPLPVMSKKEMSAKVGAELTLAAVDRHAKAVQQMTSGTSLTPDFFRRLVPTDAEVARARHTLSDYRDRDFELGWQKAETLYCIRLAADGGSLPTYEKASDGSEHEIAAKRWGDDTFAQRAADTGKGDRGVIFLKARDWTAFLTQRGKVNRRDGPLWQAGVATLPSVAGARAVEITSGLHKYPPEFLSQAAFARNPENQKKAEEAIRARGQSITEAGMSAELATAYHAETGKKGTVQAMKKARKRERKK